MLPLKLALYLVWAHLFTGWWTSEQRHPLANAQTLCINHNHIQVVIQWLPKSTCTLTISQTLVIVRHSTFSWNFHKTVKRQIPTVVVHFPLWWWNVIEKCCRRFFMYFLVTHSSTPYIICECFYPKGQVVLASSFTPVEIKLLTLATSPPMQLV